MMDEAEVLLNLGMASVVPINDGRVGEFFEEQKKITVERNFFQRFAILDPEFEAALFGLLNQPAQHLMGKGNGSFFFLLAFARSLFTELFVFGRVLLLAGDHREQFLSVI